MGRLAGRAALGRGRRGGRGGKALQVGGAVGLADDIGAQAGEGDDAQIKAAADEADEPRINLHRADAGDFAVGGVDDLEPPQVLGAAPRETRALQRGTPGDIRAAARSNQPGGKSARDAGGRGDQGHHQDKPGPAAQKKELLEPALGGRLGRSAASRGLLALLDAGVAGLVPEPFITARVAARWGGRAQREPGVREHETRVWDVVSRAETRRTRGEWAAATRDQLPNAHPRVDGAKTPRYSRKRTRGC